MSELHDLVDEIVDAVFDGTRQDTPAAIAAKEVAAQIMTGQTRRADLVAAIARLVHAVNLELAYREEMRALHSGPSLEEQLAAEPAPTPAHVSAPPPSHPEPKPTPRPLRDAIFRRYREVRSFMPQRDVAIRTRPCWATRLRAARPSTNETESIYDRDSRHDR